MNFPEREIFKMEVIVMTRLSESVVGGLEI